MAKQRVKVVTVCWFRAKDTGSRRVRRLNRAREPRLQVLGRHRSFATAGRQYARIWNTYHRLRGIRVWQEDVSEGHECGRFWEPHVVRRPSDGLVVYEEWCAVCGSGKPEWA